MVAQEKIVEKATDLWAGHVDRWIDSVNLYRDQVEKLTSLWIDQTMEVQKEGQKFVKEWMVSVNKSVADCWKAWEGGIKEASQVFAPDTGKKGKA